MRIKKESSKYVKISWRNFEIFQRFPEYGKNPEVLEFGEENIQDTSMLVGAAENASKKGIFKICQNFVKKFQHMSKVPRIW